MQATAKTHQRRRRNAATENSSYPDLQLGAHVNMAANIEQIFQDFILNKIREIEDQNEDKAYVNVVFHFDVSDV